VADPPVFVLLNEIGIIDQMAQNRIEAVQPDGLRLPHFVLLNHLMRAGDGALPARVARAPQLAKGATTNTVPRLEERGFARLDTDPANGRGGRIWRTPAGRARRQAAVRTAAEAFACLEAVLPWAAMEALIPHLRALRKCLARAWDTVIWAPQT
jgi:DNA-binding MarR family transcriptional regulator